MRPIRSAALLVLIAVLCVMSTAAAAVTTVECGVFHGYVAPNPGTSTNGSITFGVIGGTAEVIAANATLTPPADTVLATFVGAAPTCLSVTRDTGMITQMAIAPGGTVSGSVTLVLNLFGPGQDAYVIANRLVAPVAAVNADPGLAALIKTTADAGTTLSATFHVDVTTGMPTSFNVATTISGAVTLLASHDVKVGNATLPAAVIDATSRRRLTEAAGFHVPATVHVSGVGTPTQTGVNVIVTLAVSYTAPTATPTATPSPAATALPNTAFR